MWRRDGATSASGEFMLPPQIETAWLGEYVRPPQILIKIISSNTDDVKNGALAMEKYTMALSTLNKISMIQIKMSLQIASCLLHTGNYKSCCEHIIKVVSYLPNMESNDSVENSNPLTSLNSEIFEIWLVLKQANLEFGALLDGYSTEKADNAFR
ncbi:hypothetical protein GQR58_013585 [Nymphon striatum]|nr:hypothetical protein GQR58_013585 [Nymphon striatum]